MTRVLRGAVLLLIVLLASSFAECGWTCASVAEHRRETYRYLAEDALSPAEIAAGIDFLMVLEDKGRELGCAK